MSKKTSIGKIKIAMGLALARIVQSGSVEYNRLPNSEAEMDAVTQIYAEVFASWQDELTHSYLPLRSIEVAMNRIIKSPVKLKSVPSAGEFTELCAQVFRDYFMAIGVDKGDCVLATQLYAKKNCPESLLPHVDGRTLASLEARQKEQQALSDGEPVKMLEMSRERLESMFPEKALPERIRIKKEKPVFITPEMEAEREREVLESRRLQIESLKKTELS